MATSKKTSETVETQEAVAVEVVEVEQAKSVWLDSWVYLNTSRFIIAGALWDSKSADVLRESYVRGRIEWFLNNPTTLS